MMVELGAENRAVLSGLFRAYPYLHGSVAGVVHGGMGRAWADAPHEPRAALAVLDFHFLAGDPTSPAAIDLIRLLKKGNIALVPSAEWNRLLVATHPGGLRRYPREAFQAGNFDIDALQRWRDTLPAGFTLKRVAPYEVAQFSRELDRALVYNFPSHEAFSARGIGFGIMHAGRFVAGTASCAVGGGKLEFEVQTHPDFRRRGLATIAAAALILHCLEQRLEPCWDAANDWSSALACKLGFRSTGKYDAYVLG